MSGKLAVRMTILIFFLFASLSVPCLGEEAASEKLLLGFEPAENERWPADLTPTRKEEKPEKGNPYTSLNTAMTSWQIYKGKASQGQFAMGMINIGTGQAIDPKQKIPPEAHHDFGIFRNNWGQQVCLNTCGIFRRIMPQDWSAFERLRLDVICEEVPHAIRVQLEDEEISPPIIGDFTVTPGAWVTLEIDLRAAEKERKLDLKRMASLTVAIVNTTGATAKNPSALLDNIRLSMAKTSAAYTIIKDPAPLALPAYYKANTKPTPERQPDGTPDRTPLPKTEKPFVIPMPDPLAFSCSGWAAAYDNKRLMMALGGGTDLFVYQSLDGGQTWKGLDGGAKPTQVPSGVANGCLNHQVGHGDVIGKRGDAIVLSNMGCNGMRLGTLRYFSQKLTFTGSGWTLQSPPALVDCDLRHCCSNQSAVRTPDGRLWAAYGIVGRLGTLQNNVKYSDDDGVTWKSTREGTSGIVPGSMHAEKYGVGFGYTYEEPCLVPFGSGVACIWEEFTSNLTKLLWARFDGTKWSPIEEITPAPPRTGNIWFRPHLHVVSVDGKDIYLASGMRHGVLQYQQGKWSVAPIDVPFGAQVSVAGEKTVMVVAVRSTTENPRSGPMLIQAWQRGADGKWTGPRELARETDPVDGMENLNVLMPSLVVQAYAPPNFVPVAWTCKGQKWIKYLRLPVE